MLIFRSLYIKKCIALEKYYTAIITSVIDEKYFKQTMKSIPLEAVNYEDVLKGLCKVQALYNLRYFLVSEQHENTQKMVFEHYLILNLVVAKLLLFRIIHNA